MADVVIPGSHSHSSSISPSEMTAARAPRIEMVPNPDFSFPMQPQPSPRPSRPSSAHDASPRPDAMFANLSASQPSTVSHRRAVSTLPSFSFNSNDASGLKETTPPDSPQIPEETIPALTTPSRRGHRRGGSEFVGGDSRLGVSNVLSSSPTKSTVVSLPVMPSGDAPPGRRGHAHRRSAAMSSHDVSNIMNSTDVQPRLVNSLPNTPLDFPPHSTDPSMARFSTPDNNEGLSDPFGPRLEPAEDRPPSSSRRVGFSDNVTIIPRPLSTISSETESSISTLRGHSVNNSITSVLSLSTPSPPSARATRPSLSTTLEAGERSNTKSSLELSKRVEKEGEWLKRSSSSSLRRQLSESSVSPATTTFVLPETPVRSKSPHRKKQSLSYALGFDRRRSEPNIGMNAGEPSRLSAVSLQESTASSSPEGYESRHHDRLSSTRKIKAWAASVMARKSKESNRESAARSSTSSIRPASVESDSDAVPAQVSVPETPVAETDLDAVFSGRDAASEVQWSGVMPAPRMEMIPSSPHTRSQSVDETDDPAIMVDLDAALGPLQTPHSSGFRQRKELHSSRMTRDFYGPGAHYHRRAESAPILTPFESKVSGPPQPSMADVFEEDEEPEESSDELAARPVSAQDDETGMGIEIVDAEKPTEEHTFHMGVDQSLVGPRGEWEPERQLTAYPTVGLRLSNINTERRGSSIVEETIIEETSPCSEVEIVEAHEEPRAALHDPRASSLTKSSDSSEAPTILGPQADTLAPLPDPTDFLMTPETYQTSTFSSPDFNRHQNSFETSRLHTAASSIADNRTISSCHTGEHHPDNRASVDDVPSLTSSRSTMLSTMHANHSRRDFAPGERTPSASSTHLLEATSTNETTRRKRSSIQSLSQLVGGPFGSKLKLVDESRPQTAMDASTIRAPKKKEHRLKKLMFWKSKQAALAPKTP